MRELNIGTKRFTKVVAEDEPTHGGACHEYSIYKVRSPAEKHPELSISDIAFQKGPIKEFGVNGCHNEDLLAIVIDRLQSFQKGPFPCRENELALADIKEAMHWLNLRTTDRKKQNVEGTSKHRSKNKK